MTTGYTEVDRVLPIVRHRCDAIGCRACRLAIIAGHHPMCTGAAVIELLEFIHALLVA